jgi:hypothetical protein
MNPFADFDKKGPIYAIGFAYHQLLHDAGMCAGIGLCALELARQSNRFEPAERPVVIE